ncbi:MAG: L-serine dehydratase, alpha chain, partial [Planctomycetota bacterium]
MAAQLPPSIFNDVIGPVMRGPSSSHSAASVRIGRMARDLCGGLPDRVVFEFDTLGSLATTHESQGSDMGLCGGLLGWEAHDPRLAESAAALAAAGASVEYRCLELHDPHPNTYRMTIVRGGTTHRMTALSVGGGMIEVIAIDGATVLLHGDYDATVLDVAPHAEASVAAALRRHADEVQAPAGSGIVVACGQQPLPPAVLAQLQGVLRVRTMSAVLPVRSRSGMKVPFLHAGELAAHGDLHRQPLSDFALQYECARGGIGTEAVFECMRAIRTIVAQGVAAGLAGTEYRDRILPRQSHRFAEQLAAGKLLDCGLLNRAILCVTALMEV